MATDTKVQTSWAAGQIDTVAEGRPDTRIYESAARRVLNTLPLVAGGITTRPGTVIEALGDGDNRRLMRFMFNLAQRYVFVATVNGLAGYVVNADDSLGASVTITGSSNWWSGMSLTQLRELNYSQRSETMMVTLRGYQTLRLVRTGATAFTLSLWTPDTFDGKVLWPFARFQDNAITFTPSGTTGTINVTASAAYFTAQMATDQIVFILGGKQLRANSFNSSTLMQCVTIEDLDGTTATEDWEEQAWSDIRGWPGAIVFHNKRLWFGGTESLPVHLWGSVSNDFFNFDVGTGEDSDSVQGPIVSDAVADVTSLTSTSVLLAGSDQGMVYVPETDDDPVTPANYNPRFLSPNSVARAAPPARYNRAVVWPQAIGNVLRELQFSTIEAEFKADPVALTSTELLKPDYLDTCALYALDDSPIELFFVVNADGTAAVYHAIRSEEIRGLTPWEIRKPDGTLCTIESMVAVGTALFASVCWDRDGTETHSVVRFTSDTTLDLATPISNGTFTGSFSGLTTYANEPVDIVAQADDGTTTLANAYYYGQATVDGTGALTLPDELTTKDGYVGFGFLPLMEGLPKLLQDPRGVFINRPYRIAEITALMNNTSSVAVNGRRQELRQVGFDPSVTPTRYSGVIREWGTGWSRRGVTTVSAAEPLPWTLMALEERVMY